MQQATKSNRGNNGRTFVMGLIIVAGLGAILFWLVGYSGVGLGDQTGVGSNVSEQTRVTATPDPCQQTRADYDTARTFNYRGVYFIANKKLKPFDTQIVVHHRVPLEVILLHPCLFTTAELGLSTNLTGIPKVLNPSIHQSMIQTRWNSFWANHPNATRAEVEMEAVAVDQLYGLPDLAYRHFGVRP